eukprot:6593421-Pyramimonas_sp.AAC.1
MEARRGENAKINGKASGGQCLWLWGALSGALALLSAMCNILGCLEGCLGAMVGRRRSIADAILKAELCWKC